MTTQGSGARSAQWIFDGPPDSGEITGGDLTSYVFRPDLDTLVRETIQNSNDQSIDSGRVEVVFEFHRLEGSAKSALLAGLGWEQLAPHLEGVASSASLMKGDVQTCLDEVEAPLTVLVVRDLNTKGLYGSEDDTDGNFAPLCRHRLVTTDDKAKGGGSYGLGKTVLWSFSGVSTVLFASRPYKRSAGQGALRFIARSVLPYHLVGNTKYSGSGWLGRSSDEPDRNRAVSMWDGAAEAQILETPLGLSADSTGTAILIPFFREPKQDGERDLISVAADTLRSIDKWFWPSLVKGTLSARVEVYDGGDLVHSSSASASVDEVAPFVAALAEDELVEHAIEPDELAERMLPMAVPQRREEALPTEDLSGHFRLRVLRADPTDPSHPLSNRIAFMRGAGMVVKYHTPKQMPLDGGRFFGVLEAGLAHGTTPSDEVTDEFLRAAEPPAHDTWEGSTNRLNSEYKAGANARLKELHAAVDAAVLEICRSTPPESADGPDRLKKLFPIGKDGPKPKPRLPGVTVTIPEASVADGTWRASIQIHRNGDDRLWNAVVTLRTDAESGIGTGLRIIKAESEDCDVRVSSENEFSVVGVDSHNDEVSVEIEADGAGLDSGVLSRARLSATARELKGLIHG